MNTQTQEALKMAIAQLSEYRESQVICATNLGYEELWATSSIDDAIQACKEALAQPAQEPVAFTNSDELSELQSGMTTCYMYKQAIDDDDIALYTHPCVLMHSAPVQEPVAWIEVTTHHEKYQTSKVILLDKGIKLPHDTPLYTHPAPPCQECENLKHDLEGYMDANKELINREWQGLSDDDMAKLCDKYWDSENGHSIKDIITMIEQALKEKNT